jgi:hypothetical protein
MATGDKDDGQFRTRFLHQPLQFESVDDRHSDIRDYAVNLGQTRLLQERLRRGEHVHRMAGRLQQILQGLQQAHVIIDHGYD